MVTDSRDIFSGAAGLVPSVLTDWPLAFGETSVDMGVPSGRDLSGARGWPLQMPTLYRLD
jgi:hypothetical protein